MELIIVLYGDTESLLIKLPYCLLKSAHLSVTICKVAANLDDTVVDILSHGEAFSVVSFDPVLGLIENPVRGWAAECFRMT